MMHSPNAVVRRWCLVATLGLVVFGFVPTSSAQVGLSELVANPTDQSVTLMLSSPVSIGGFQFEVTGAVVSPSGAYGAAIDASFDTSLDPNAVISYSTNILSDYIPAGTDINALTFGITPVSGVTCVTDLVVSDITGTEISMPDPACISTGATFDFANIDPGAGTVDVIMSTFAESAGFEFAIDGLEVLSMVPGADIAPGMTFDTSDQAVVAYYPTFDHTPPYSDTLLGPGDDFSVATIELGTDGTEACIEAATVSSRTGVPIPVISMGCLGTALSFGEPEFGIGEIRIPVEARTLFPVGAIAFSVEGVTLEEVDGPPGWTVVPDPSGGIVAYA
ncbi:MAG: hypothetical protein KC561_12365, partial [Myxococcales bacterium]|nr:hypothetical protein [Myxococcales bacterium]